MFGSSLVEPYIGELWLAHTADSAMKDDMGGLSTEDLEKMSEEERHAVMEKRFSAMQEESEFKKAKRQVQCAQNLRKRVNDMEDIDFQRSEELPAVKAALDAFVAGAHEEAVHIAQGAQGDMYLKTIGFTMEKTAEEYLGFETSFLGMGGHLAHMQQNFVAFGGNMSVLGAGIKAATAGAKAMQQAEEMQKEMEEKGAINEEQAAMDMQETIDSSLPTFLEFAWSVNKRDIQSTLKKVCRKLFDDATVPKHIRLRRAEGVRLLGREFHLVGTAAAKLNKTKMTADDIKAQLSVAAMATMAKAQGQELTKEDQDEMMRQAKQQLDPSQQQEQQAQEVPAEGAPEPPTAA